MDTDTQLCVSVSNILWSSASRYRCHGRLHALQSEAAFADGVPLHLAAAAGDRVDLGVAEAVFRPPSGDRLARGVLHEPSGPAEVEEVGCGPHVRLARVELGPVADARCPGNVVVAAG